MAVSVDLCLLCLISVGEDWFEKIYNHPSPSDLVTILALIHIITSTNPY